MTYRIKPLAWAQIDDWIHEGKAEGLFYLYRVSGFFKEAYQLEIVVCLPGAYRRLAYLDQYPTLEAAKAAAEADWQARIKEALEPVPSGWISVKERLPEGWVDVLITNGEFVCRGYYNSAVWFVSFDGGESDPEEITHWQPLPEPPREEEQ